MDAPTAKRLADGRLHLHHGPIDLIIEAWGKGRGNAYAVATTRFRTLLGELVDELDILRAPVGKNLPKGSVARRMVKAAMAHNGVFVTPMAAVAGAVADEVRACIGAVAAIERAYVNNGGDISVYLSEGQQMRAAIHDGSDAGRVHFRAEDAARGLATSGWKGRSLSLGIADAVSVVARDAATADVAATLIANAVDLPGHMGIERQKACDLIPDSDLGARLVTTDVGTLSPAEVAKALERGAQVAAGMLSRGTMLGAALFLCGQGRQVGNVGSLALAKP
ncbi:MAG: UPF0280 family protein [Rhodobacteraceae bacterium]|nr:UPF0280 family protein [Paracoccaceae bacterium]